MADALRVQLRRLPHGDGLPLPSPASAGSAGLDLYAAVAEEVEIGPGERRLVPTGLAIALPPGWEGQVRPRSGLSLRHGVTVLNAPGTVDSDYRGEVGVILVNHGRERFRLRRGERIAQLVVSRTSVVEWDEVAELDASRRGGGGFGSTGR